MTTTDPADGLPRTVRAARATVPGRPAVPGAPHRTAGGKTSPPPPSAPSVTPAMSVTAPCEATAGVKTPARGGQRRAASAPRAGSNPIAAAMSEGELEEQVQALCTGLGILRFHNPDSRRMERGLPDDILIGPRGVLWRELKNMKRKLTPEQEKVGEQLTAHGQDWAVWRPSDLLSQRIRHELMAISALKVATA